MYHERPRKCSSSFNFEHVGQGKLLVECRIIDDAMMRIVCGVQQVCIIGFSKISRNNLILTGASYVNLICTQ
jgi:hypothetical protein